MQNTTPQEITIRYFKVDPKDIVYIKAVLEGYEGMAVVRTTDADQDVIEILIAHDFSKTINRVIQDLQGEVEMEEALSTAHRPPKYLDPANGEY